MIDFRAVTFVGINDKQSLRQQVDNEKYTSFFVGVYEQVGIMQ